MTSIPELKIGDQLADRYALREEIAEGAMGIVYQADDNQGGNSVALKVLRPELVDDSQMRRRFSRESAALKALSHPNILQVIDAGVDSNDRAYLVTELLKGQTLAELIEDAPLHVNDLKTFLLQACAALNKAHQHGIIHGDLKPSNLFVVDEDGRRSIKVFDFGASKILGIDRLTATGELAGTPKYMAPEVLKGSREIDGRIDVYALGIIAYESLCSRSPFSQSNPARLLFAIAQGEATPISEIVEVSPEIAATIATAMHVDPAERFESASKLAESVRYWSCP